ncbi:MAG: integration host factor subunit beta [Planctomycetes bacterium]|nr:integration host factor subunit beta [Planctomycetota bacterium]
MATITKKELIDRIAEATGETRVTVKKTIQSFLDNVIVELGKGNRLEFRDFGVFEIKQRAARMAQNPKTLEPVQVPPKRTVKFKAGRMMQQVLTGPDAVSDNSPSASTAADVG